MSIKGFKLSNGSIVRYDYSALDNIVTDDSLSVPGVAADGKAVGDEIAALEARNFDLDESDRLKISGLSGTTSEVTDRIEQVRTALGTEVATRMAADASFEADMVTERNVRAAADNTEKSERVAADGAEEAARVAADNALSTRINIEKSRIDNIEALPDGSTTADAELINIRIGYDDTVYSSAGNAVRAQISDVKSDFNQLVDGVAVYGIGDSIDYTFNEDGGMWRYVNGAWVKTKTSGVAYYHMVTYPVEGGKSYRVKGTHASYTPLATFWTDDGTEPIGYSQDGYPERTREVITLDVVAPENATKMIVTAFTLTTYPTVNELVYVNNLSPRTETLESKMTKLQTTGYRCSLDPTHINFEYDDGVTTTIQITIPYRMYLFGYTSSPVLIKFVSGNTDPLTYTLPSGSYLIYDFDTSAVVIASWADISTTYTNYILLARNSGGDIVAGELQAYWNSYMSKNLKDWKNTLYPPFYYFLDDYLQDKVIDVREKAKSADANFGFLTDVHVNLNYKKSMVLMKYISDYTNAVPFVLFGGDVPMASGEDLEESLSYGDQWLNIISVYGKENVYQCKGNHDYGLNIDGHWVGADVKTDYYYICKNTEHKVNGSPEHLYYYFDDDVNKIRYIVLDCYDYGYPNNSYNTTGISQNQYDWLISALDIDGYDILVLSHQTSDSTLTNYESVLTPLQAVLKAFANKTTLSYSGNNVVLTGDFTDCTSRLICHLSGHSHKDEYHVDDNVLSIVSVCDAHYASPSGYTRGTKTINEQAFDIFNITKSTRTIDIIRIGAGADRSFTY